MKWEQKLWAIKFTGAMDDPPMLIGEGWHHNRDSSYYGEPLRPLLFTTRKAARTWCKNQHAKYAGRTDCCAEWSFVPVRVSLVVKPI